MRLDRHQRAMLFKRYNAIGFTGSIADRKIIDKCKLIGSCNIGTGYTIPTLEFAVFEDNNGKQFVVGNDGFLMNILGFIEKYNDTYKAIPFYHKDEELILKRLKAQAMTDAIE